MCVVHFRIKTFRQVTLHFFQIFMRPGRVKCLSHYWFLLVPSQVDWFWPSQLHNRFASLLDPAIAPVSGPTSLTSFYNIDQDAGNVSEAYLDWEQDQSIISGEMLTRVIGCKFTWHLCDKIHSDFHSLTCAKACQIRNELRSLSLKNHPIFENFLQIQTLVNSHTSIGDSISPGEHLEMILNGLPEEYESTVWLVCNKFEPFTVDEVETLLLEQKLPSRDIIRDLWFQSILLKVQLVTPEMWILILLQVLIRKHKSIWLLSPPPLIWITMITTLHQWLRWLEF